MNCEQDGSSARALILLCGGLGPVTRGTPAPLSAAEWQRIGIRLREAGLSHPGELLAVGPDFWGATGLTEEEVTRLQGLLAGECRLEAELERLRELGIRTVTSLDLAYPARLRERLRGLAPRVLFGAGEWQLLERPALAMAGSREVDEQGAAFTAAVARRCAREGLAVVTGGARGVDQIALLAALEAGGSVIGVLAGDLERRLREAEVRRWLEEGSLLLLSPFHPGIGFTVINAMMRNKAVYALADYGLVVSSAAGQGGTWAGAREVLRHGWVPLFVRDGASVPEGNRELLRPAARPFPPLESLSDETLRAWLERQVTPSASAQQPPEQTAGVLEEGHDLFPLAWPHLAEFLRVTRSLQEIAEWFHLHPQQVRFWLERAGAEGKVATVRKKPPLFRVVVEPPLQSTLLEPAAAYHTHSHPDSPCSADSWSW
jgi:DNA processing protein